MSRHIAMHDGYGAQVGLQWQPEAISATVAPWRRLTYLPGRPAAQLPSQPPYDRASEYNSITSHTSARLCDADDRHLYTATD